MKAVMKLSLLAAMSLIFCPACGQGEGASSPETSLENSSLEAAQKPEIVAKAPQSLSEAMEVARKEGKNILVEYTDAKCPYCRQMNSQTLALTDVKASIAENVVWVRYDVQEDASEFESKWGKMPTPTFVVLNSAGEKLGAPISGVVSAAAFKSYVSWAKTGEGPVPSFKTGGS
jgi:thioredoxin-related protein